MAPSDAAPLNTPDERGAVSAQVPEETQKPDLTALPNAAAGVTAVLKSVATGFREMGAVRTAQLFTRVNQRDGFDCPSCAWADPEDERQVFEFCENGAKAFAGEATRKTVTPEFFARWSVGALSRQSDHWLNAQGRLTHPMILEPSATHYRPIDWKDAFQVAADALNSLASPDEAVFYTSGKATNEAAFLFQLFARMYGTNNLPDCSNMCHESSGLALRQTLGTGKSTVRLQDLEHSECIFVIGQNPGTNHPRMLTSLEKAVQNGAAIVAVNPLPEVGLMRFRHPQHVSGVLGNGTALAKLFLQVRINGDLALLKAILRLLLEAEDERPGTVLDRDFIRDHTSGFAEFEAAVRAADMRELIEQCGVPLEQMREAADIVARSKSMVCCWAMGLTQHKNAVATIREVVNLLLLRGNIGKPNAGVLCVRGHSNVQGDRTMGIWEQMDDAFLDRLDHEFAFEAPRGHGCDTVAAIRGLHEGRYKALVSLGGNFLSATPDTEFVAEGLRRCRLTVQIATKLNRAHLVTGETALLLPCLGRTESDVQASGPQFTTVENTVCAVSASRGGLKPASPHLKSEVAIVAGLAGATIVRRGSADWAAMTASYDRIRDHIAHVVPGFENFNQRIRGSEPFYAPVPARERRFRTETGKANFFVNPVEPVALEKGQFLMMTVRTHDQFNTTIYGLDDRYRGIHHGRRVVLMNAEDMCEFGLTALQPVDLTSHFQGEQRHVKRFLAVPYDIPRRSVATYFPEANALISVNNFADFSHTPVSKSTVVTIAKSV